MGRYSSRLPQLGGKLFITDGGMETTLIFQEGRDLPHFAVFPLLDRPLGPEILRNYYRKTLELARQYGVGTILDSVTWRANPDWAVALGYSEEDLKRNQQASIALLREIRAEYESPMLPIVVNGTLGPRGDGYVVTSAMEAATAEAYHHPQIATLHEAGADMVTAYTLTFVEEAIGIARAAHAIGIPSVPSFTVETDGRLPSGQALGEAIAEVDAATDAAPAYYMLNCAHPVHFADALMTNEAWARRLRGIRANASTLSHAELDAAEDLDRGNPQDLGARYARLVAQLPQLVVLGGCCGTDLEHIEAICRSVQCAAI